MNSNNNEEEEFNGSVGGNANNNNENENEYENGGSQAGGRRRSRKHKTHKSKSSTRSSGSKIPAVGTKAQVWHETAKHTSGGLTKSDLMKTKKGRIVSRKKHAAGKKALKNLVKAGYKAKKGTFKLFKK